MSGRSDVVVLYNRPRVAAPGADSALPHAESDAGIMEEVRAVAEALDQLGIAYRTAAVSRLEEIAEALLTGVERVVVNLVESLDSGVFDAPLVPVVCRALGRSVTGNPGVCQALCLDKWQCKAALEAGGVPSPYAEIVPVGAAPLGVCESSDRVLVKPCCTDASEGIGEASVIPVTEPGRIRDAVAGLHRLFGQPALVEAFIDGREINVAVLQCGDELIVLPPAEIDFSAFPAGKPRIVDYEAKWRVDSFAYNNTPRILPAPLSDELRRRIEETALQAWRALGCRDYARIDFRVDRGGHAYVLEVNPNPDISPDAGFAAALTAGKVSYRDFVGAIVSNARARVPSAGEARPPAPAAEPPAIRATIPEDRQAILALLEASGRFSGEELAVAKEVLDAALEEKAPREYWSYTALVDDRPAGWVCFGPTPCTVGTYDVYWIAVAPALQSRGLGSRLLAHAEHIIAGLGGELIVIETSSRPSYDPTRAFYLRQGYVQSGSIPDFYARGDSRAIFTKRVDAGAAASGVREAPGESHAKRHD